MITLLTVHGALMCVGPQGQATGYEVAVTAAWEAVAGAGGSKRQRPPAAYKGFLSQFAISPTMPRRKASTQITKITPCTIVTQAPSSAR